MKDPWTRKQPAANYGLGNIAASQHDASSEDCLDVFDLKQRCWTDRCVSSKYRESYKRASPNAFSHRTYTIVIHYSRVSCDSIIAASAVEKSRFFHIAILSQIQLIVQPLYICIFIQENINSAVKNK